MPMPIPIPPSCLPVACMYKLPLMPSCPSHAPSAAAAPNDRQQRGNIAIATVKQKVPL